MELQQMMVALSEAFLGPLRDGLGGVQGVAMPLLNAAIPLVAGVHLIRSAAGAQLPIGTLLHSFLTIGIAQAAITLWPTVISGTLDQVDMLGGLAGSETTDPFEILTAGAALSTLAFNHAGSALGYFSGHIIAALFAVAGVAIFASYTLISAFSLMAWTQYWASAVILAPLIAFLPIFGMSQSGFVPLSFLISSTMRIVALSLISSYGTDLLSEYALPGIDEEVEWIHAFIAVGLATVMLWLAWQANSLIGGMLDGRSGFTGGVQAVTGAIAGAGRTMVGGIGGGGAKAGASAARTGGGGGAGPGAGGGGGVGVTSAAVNARRRGA